MNKALPIVAIVIVLALGFWWWMSHHSSKATDSTASNTSTSTSSSIKKTSIQALMATGAPVTCSFSSDAESGKIYVSGKKMRGDFVAATEKTHMISDGTNMYVWTDGSTQGFKMAVPADNSAAAQTNAGTPDLSADMDYDCGVWVPTAASFTPPSNVSFSSGLEGLGDLLKQAQTAN